MLVLGLDTSTSAVAVALARVTTDTGRLSDVVERSVVAANRHGELLAPLVDEVRREASVERSALSAVAVGVGPGPFTGLRVGVMTARAIADALQIPVYGVCSLDALAHAAADAEEPFAVATDARRKQVYWARYDASGRRLAGPDLARPDELAVKLLDTVKRVVGSGAVLYASEFASYTIVDGYPSGAGVVALAAARAVRHDPSEAVEPMYLRRPDARPPVAPKKVTPP